MSQVAGAMPKCVKGLFSPRKGDRAQQRILCLPRVEPRVLDDDRSVRLEHARVTRAERNRLRIGEMIESKMMGSPRRDRNFVRPDRLSVGVKNRQLNVCFIVGGIENAERFMAGEFRCRSVAPAGDVALGDGPDSLSDGLFHGGKCGVRS